MSWAVGCGAGYGKAALVDANRVEARIQRLEGLIERLDEVRRAGEDADLADEQQRAAAERWLQVAVQICVDLGTQLVTENLRDPHLTMPMSSRSSGRRASSRVNLRSDSPRRPNSAISSCISIWRSTIARCSPHWRISTIYASSGPPLNDWPIRKTSRRPIKTPDLRSERLHRTSRIPVTSPPQSRSPSGQPSAFQAGGREFDSLRAHFVAFRSMPAETSLASIRATGHDVGMTVVNEKSRVPPLGHPGP